MVTQLTADNRLWSLPCAFSFSIFPSSPAAGAIESSLITHHYDVIEVAYVEARVRVQVKVIGTLPDAVVKPQRQPRPPSPDLPAPVVPLPVRDNPHWPFSSAEEAQRDELAGLTPPTLRGVVGHMYMCVLYAYMCTYISMLCTVTALVYLPYFICRYSIHTMCVTPVLLLINAMSPICSKGNV